jgi:large subunit ribosomal protein L31
MTVPIIRMGISHVKKASTYSLWVDEVVTDVYTTWLTMKKDIHPTNYRPVVFQDLNNGDTFITRSTVAAEGSITLDGVEYPLVKIHISRTSHPFFTGEERIVDIEGRVDKFKARAAAGQAAKDKRAAKAQKVAKRAEVKAQKAADAVADKAPATPSAKTTKK